MKKRILILISILLLVSQIIFADDFNDEETIKRAKAIIESLEAELKPGLPSSPASPLPSSVFQAGKASDLPSEAVVPPPSSVSHLPSILPTLPLPLSSKKSHRNYLEISFIDVHQGDCIFIRFPNGKTMLIDSGYKTHSKNVIEFINDHGKGINEGWMSKGLSYLFDNRLQKIDAVVITHADADHIGSMKDILKKFKVKNFYDPGIVHTSGIYRARPRFLKQASPKGNKAESKNIKGFFC